MIAFLPGEEKERTERYRRMSPGEKLACVVEMNRAEDERQRADLRARNGDLSGEEMRIRLATQRLGRDVVVKMFGRAPVD